MTTAWQDKLNVAHRDLDYYWCHRHGLDGRTPEDHRLHEEDCRHFEAEARVSEGGSDTYCPIPGVHEHAFRGPHHFREWEPMDISLEERYAANDYHRGRADALRDIIEWLDAEVAHPRPDPHPAMRLQADTYRAILSGEGPAPIEADPPASAPGPLDPAAVLNHAIGEAIATTPPRKKRKPKPNYAIVNDDEGDEAP